MGFNTFTDYDLSMKLDGVYMKYITTLIGELNQRHFEILLLYICRFMKPREDPFAIFYSLPRGHVNMMNVTWSWCIINTNKTNIIWACVIWWNGMTISYWGMIDLSHPLVLTNTKECVQLTTTPIDGELIIYVNMTTCMRKSRISWSNLPFFFFFSLVEVY
mgnify:CR=1 FL=1